MSAHNDARWTHDDPDAVAWCTFEDGYVAYHRPSGNTHFLNADTYRLVTDVLAEPHGIASATAALGWADQEDRLGDVRELLLRLETVGLVRRV